MSNFTDPIKASFGAFMRRFHSQVIGDTPGVQDWASRHPSKAAAFAPGRMVDDAEKMLETYRKNDTSGATQPTPKLPVMLVAMAKDFMPAPPEFGRLGGDWVDVHIPDDPKHRLFKMRTVTAQIRTQVLIVAADQPTATSLAMQLHAFFSSMENRRFPAVFKLAGLDEKWPVQIELPDVIMPNVQTDQNNLSMLVCDLSLHATVPMLKAPRSNEPNDGQGDGANQDSPFEDDYDPSGYLFVTQADGRNFSPSEVSPPNTDNPEETWTVGGQP